jgi:hypothetical protein
MPANDTTPAENQDKTGAAQAVTPRKSREKPKKDKEWLARNIHSLLAIVVLSMTFYLYWQIIFCKLEDGRKDIILYLLGALTTISTQVVSYYFGSSSGSASKTEELKELHENKQAGGVPAE